MAKWVWLGYSTTRTAKQWSAMFAQLWSSTFLPACSVLCVYLCLISRIPNLIVWFMSKHSHKLGVLTHTFPILLTSRVSALTADSPPVHIYVCVCLCVGVNAIFPSVFLHWIPFRVPFYIAQQGWVHPLDCEKWGAMRRLVPLRLNNHTGLSLSTKIVFINEDKHWILNKILFVIKNSSKNSFPTHGTFWTASKSWLFLNY